MDLAAILYLGITAGLFLVFALIVKKTLKRSSRQRLEEPKHRMLEDD